jgi:ABC-type transporter Mla MlaB component
VQFSFDALETLEQLLRLHTPMGDAQVPQLWWQLRLSLLRLLGLQDDFELVALDFCVTYEISPPSWQPAQCQVVALPPSAKPQEATEVVRSSAAAGHPLSLSGEVLGDVTPLLPNPAALGGIGQTVAISCAQLRRVDFSAGGSLLNWLANAQAAGCQIRLVDVPQLLVAFFNLIGLHEHAHIVVRNY